MTKTTTTKPWHQVVQLRDDILNQELSQKQFAADLYDVVMGRNPGVYHDAKEFFALTYPTVKLRDLARDVTQRLSGRSEKAVRQLHMTFGGGKTHALITLVHLVRDPATLPDIPTVQQFHAHCALGGGLPKARVASVVFDRLDAEKGMEVSAPDGSVLTIKMPWSAIAWQLAGPAGMRLLKDDGTERSTPPATGVMEDLLKLARRDGSGVLILFDEVLWFVRVMASTDPAWIGRMREFMHSLTQAVAKVPQCCLVASLLASDPGKMDELGKQISKELYDEFKRVADEGIQPVESQDVPEILRRRLIKLESHTDRSQWPSQVFGALNGVQGIDDSTEKNRAAEEKRYTDAYPFHPALIETLYQKWTQLEGFQQTRGILKTLASALRDAVQWDQQPLIGAQIFLANPTTHGLSAAARELANVAQLEQYEGRRQDWPAILEAELVHARKAQDDLLGVRQREIEQAVISTFLHSQPIGQRATTREIKVLIGVGAPDRIELDKGLSRWSGASWYLDDMLTGDREGGLPKMWRLGSRPNLKQMHHDARQNVSATLVDEVLEKEIRGAGKLTENARGAGARVHMLPARPADIEDDGEFHYAVLGPRAAGNGKPSAEAKRFIDETTGPERPRAQNRNAVVLAVPSRDGIDVAREKVRDLLGWERVREMLKARSDIDTAATTRLEGNVRVARGEMVSQIVMAYCIAVTVNDGNDIAAYRINVDNEPLFSKMLADKRLRIERTAVNAEALLPGGPFDLWSAGDKARFVKDLVGAFAATARLPKMLNRTAILETLLQGCERGNFALRVTRADKSSRTFWMCRPDEHAIQDTSLEVVLSDAATLSELDPQLLAPGKLPGLWDQEPITLAELRRYFSGTHFVEIDKGGYTENLPIPAATPLAIADATAGAVKSGRVWLVNGMISVLSEDVPPGFINESAHLFSPPPPVAGVDVLPAQLATAWQGDESNAHLIHAALSSRAGKPLPWSRVAHALDEAFRIGLIERSLDSGAWPCDPGGASAVKVRARKSEAQEPPPAKHYGSKRAATELQTHEVQDLAENIDALREATAGYPMRICVTLEIGEDSQVDQAVVDKVNAVLEQVKAGWRVG
ncbi:ATP-binding protein [Verminephrobacter aporrectodeae subsp. tuberculatae]|uniref:DUF499 domain-containing protein n=1 Tax=Verminephrobacter aporrectodeae TaxID=1110389 RepID=UPI002243A933|nr:DUF499 domain-containing protein [Verminephrobacter aporrectodeae]MCW8197073.1 ATP-binding protein [Verminephrobacter aporrectodeae subsp. tuberculatae]